MEIQKSPCIKQKKFESSCFNTRRFKNIRVLNHGDSKTSVFYTRRFFFKRPITRWNHNRWWKYFRVWIRGLCTTNLWKKQSSKISCYCPFNGTVTWDFRTLFVSSPMARVLVSYFHPIKFLPILVSIRGKVRGKYEMITPCFYEISYKQML